MTLLGIYAAWIYGTLLVLDACEYLPRFLRWAATLDRRRGDVVMAVLVCVVGFLAGLYMVAAWFVLDWIRNTGG